MEKQITREASRVLTIIGDHLEAGLLPQFAKDIAGLDKAQVEKAVKELLSVGAIEVRILADSEFYFMTLDVTGDMIDVSLEDAVEKYKDAFRKNVLRRGSA